MRDRPESVERFPLAWPLGWTRTLAGNRQRAKFQTKTYTTDGRAGALSVIVAVGRLEDELRRLGAGDSPTLSTNVPLRLDGRPRSESEPTDPGAAVYFVYKGRARVFACDRFNRVADNIAAIAAHVEALRAIDRFGVGSLEQALEGYKALPADTAADWRMVLDFPPNSAPTVAQVMEAYKRETKIKHPDRSTGSDEAFAQLQRARDFALAELNRR